MASWANPKHRPVDAAAVPQPETPSPVDVAAQDEIKRRLAEQEHAEHLQRQEPPPQQASEPQEPQQQPSQLPPAVQAWLSEHPQFINDRKANLRLQLAHEEAAEAGINIGHADYLAALEERLGLRSPPPSPRQEVPQDAPHSHSVMPSAPPTREAPSMGSGRRPSEGEKLTPQELAFCHEQHWDPTTYLRNKIKLTSEKRAGLRQ
jgi:hypothetical protein